MSQGLGGAIGPNVAWTKVDVLTSYQRLTAEMQIRGRIRETINDPEPLFHLRNVSAEPLLPGAVPLNGVPEGPHGLAITGLAGSLDEAMAALKERWTKWLASAELSETN